MTVPFMQAYTELLIQTCHRRGAFAMGGMSAFIPNRREPEVTERALAAVRADKRREASDGCDGTWVAHPDLVPVVMEIFDEIAAAERARKQAADALDEYEKNLAEARAEAKAMLEQTKAEQAELAASLKAKADKELTELRDRARQDIEAAKRAAVNEIYAESVALASNIAGKILQREVSAGDQQRLVEESLAEMQGQA